MIPRIKQFFNALSAKVSDEERRIIKQTLSRKEWEIFNQMSIVDQRHAFDVYMIIKKYLTQQSNIEDKKNFFLQNLLQQNLLKVALLHDVGKQAGDLSLLDRILIVLLENHFPQLLQRWARAGQGSFLQNRRHALYIALNHSFLGAQILRQIDADQELVRLVENHHDSKNLDWQVQLLQKADSQA